MDIESAGMKALDLARSIIRSARGYEYLADSRVIFYRKGEPLPRYCDEEGHPEWNGMYVNGSVYSEEGPLVFISLKHHHAAAIKRQVDAIAETILHEIGHALWELLDVESRRTWSRDPMVMQNDWGAEEAFAETFMFLITGKKKGMISRKLFRRLSVPKKS
jgi:hypothetical protein